jgi:hypothetical protein
MSEDVQTASCRSSTCNGRPWMSITLRRCVDFMCILKPNVGSTDDISYILVRPLVPCIPGLDLTLSIKGSVAAAQRIRRPRDLPPCPGVCSPSQTCGTPHRHLIKPSEHTETASRRRFTSSGGMKRRSWVSVTLHRPVDFYSILFFLFFPLLCHGGL